MMSISYVKTIIAAGALMLCGLCSPARAQGVQTCDVLVYGASSAGVAAAVQAARMGRDTIMIAPTGHVGGLTTGGLGQTDIGSRSIIGGFAGEFYSRVYDYYDNPAAWIYEDRSDYLNEGPWEWYFRYERDWTRRWSDGFAFTFEPSVASHVMDQLLAEAGVRVMENQKLLRDNGAGVSKDNGRIISIEMEDGTVYEAAVFVDGTYEGDLLAEAGVAYFVGRESNDIYGETINGIQTARRNSGHQFSSGIDPWVIEGDSGSGLLPGIDPDGPGGEDGQGDHRVQAYCLRITLSYEPGNMVSFAKPAAYDEKNYELLFRQFEVAGRALSDNTDTTALPLLVGRMPNLKTDANTNGGLSINLIGASWEWPEASYERRAQIYEDHRRHAQGLLWTLQNHESIPEAVRAEAAKWGLPADEFSENDHWTPQLYVREARRMVSDKVMTQNEVNLSAAVTDPVAMGGYAMDSHHVQRYVTADGYVQNEGNMYVGSGSYGISYRSLVPARADNVGNLLVAACVSASHAAWGSIRMEPTFMMLGHAAGVAAALVVDKNLAVQDLDYFTLREKLEEDGQILPALKAVDPGTLKGIVMDNTAAEKIGDWNSSASEPMYVADDYLHDGNAEEGALEVRYRMEPPAAGLYEVRLSYTAHSNRAGSVPVTIKHADGQETVHIDQRVAPPIDGLFISLGKFRFDDLAEIVIGNSGTDGYVIADAVQLLRKGTIIGIEGRATSQLIRNLEAGNNQVVVAYGTSLTANGAWVEQLDTVLNEQYPGMARLVNSGGAGEYSSWGVQNLDDLVIQQKPDTVFIEFSINDSVERFDVSVELARANLETMIDRILESNPKCEIILMTMTPGDMYPEGHSSYRKDIAAHYEMYRSVAGQKNLLLIDHYPNWMALKAENTDLFFEYVPDSIHPTALGCSTVVTPVILNALGIKSPN